MTPTTTETKHHQHHQHHTAGGGPSSTSSLLSPLPSPPTPTLTPDPPRNPAPRGVVYGGVARWPTHPLSDMHGLVRVIFRTRFFAQVIEGMARYGVDVRMADLDRTWAVTSSIVEQVVTETHYGVPLVARLTNAYLSSDSYTLVPHTYKLSRRRGA